MAKQVNRSRTRYRRLVNCLVTSASVIARVIAGHARSLARANEWNPRAWDKRLLIGGCAARRIRIWIKNALITTGWPDFSFCLSKGERERERETESLEREFLSTRDIIISGTFFSRVHSWKHLISFLFSTSSCESKGIIYAVRNLQRWITNECTRRLLRNPHLLFYTAPLKLTLHTRARGKGVKVLLRLFTVV